MAVNVELLNKVMEHIEAHPREHDQGQWAQQTGCGTTYCFAGHAVFMMGWTPVFDEDSTAAYCTSPEGDAVWPIESTAREILGLSGAQSTHLFFDCITASELREYVNEIVAELP